ncbi:hypothetical protein [uncultured Roseobacter sp.]|uniref:hypothetical protein n=1 Tax=uncultured Roseobacter sp. TaxID=114847 RepID=UPI0026031776|nr:hypothetical protein [uncultured Roseobacter sp.]
MNDDPLRSLAEALDALPHGTFYARVKRRRYIATKTQFNDGKSTKLVAEELGGKDYISFNYYRLTTGARLYPCEMSREKVIAFVLAALPEGAAPQEEA